MSTLTPKQAVAHFRRAASAVQPAVIAAETETVKEALAEAVHLSSGPHSAAQLRAAGHPYGRGNRNVSYAAEIINMQSGAFRTAWSGVNPALSGSRIVSRAVNNSAPAKFLASGTRNMVARPIGNAVQQAVQPGRIARLKQAVRAALKARE